MNRLPRYQNRTIHLMKPSRRGTYSRKTWCGRKLKDVAWTSDPTKCHCKACKKAMQYRKPSDPTPWPK